MVQVVPVEKSYKVFTYRIYRQFTQQCTLFVIRLFSVKYIRKMRFILFLGLIVEYLYPEDIKKILATKKMQVLRYDYQESLYSFYEKQRYSSSKYMQSKPGKFLVELELHTIGKLNILNYNQVHRPIYDNCFSGVKLPD